MTRIAVFNQKGGVGKTTTVLNLAAALCKLQLKPLVIDMDPQYHLTEIQQSKPYTSSESLFAFYQDNLPLSQLAVEWKNVGLLVPSHKELIKVDSIFGKGPTILNRLKQGLDALQKEKSNTHILIDCCPYLGVLSLSAIFAADLMLIPIGSDFLSLQGAQKVEHTLRALEPVLKRRVNRRYFMTSYDKRRGMTFEVEKQARELFGIDVCASHISENVAVAESPQYKKDVFSYNASSKGAQDYSALLNELMESGLIKNASAFLQ